MSSVPAFPFARIGNLDPPPEYARLRSRTPVVQVKEMTWLLTGYQEIKNVLADNRFHIPTFESVVDDPSLPQNPPRHTRLRRLAEKAFTPVRAGAVAT